jgi:hypothetical protein
MSLMVVLMARLGSIQTFSGNDTSLGGIGDGYEFGCIGAGKL